MSAEEKNKLDDIFKQGLGEPDTFAEYNSQDWDSLEQLLDADKPVRGIIYRMIPVISSIAALLLLFLGWLFFKPNTTGNTTTVAVVKHTDSNTVAVNKPAGSPQQLPSAPATNSVNQQTSGTDNKGSGASGSNPALVPAVKSIKPAVKTGNGFQYAAIPNKAGTGKGVQTNAVTPPVIINEKQNVQPVTEAPKQNIIANNTVNNNTTAMPPNSIAGTTNPVNTGTTTVGGENTAVKTIPEQIASTGGGTAPDALKADPTAAPVKKPKISSASGFKPQFGVAMLLAPDINGASSFQNAKVGTNVGLLFSVGITKKLTISTGAGYSKKPYSIGFDQYHVGYKFKTDPQDVYADCRVLDIPINVDYKLYNRNHNSFSVGTGLSSYFMLRETYNYDYADPATVGPASFTVTNKNKHILGVMNLNATYEHQLNGKFSIAAQPYLKIPLTDIGNSQVRLQSAGIALGVRWNINHR